MRKNKTCGIYCIENLINNKKYIGQSINIEARWYVHKYKLNKNKHDNGHLQNAWNKYGEENFRFYIVEECNQKELNEKEIFYINSWNLLDDKYGYNDKQGGQFGRLSDDANKRISESLRKYYSDLEVREKKSESAFKQWSNPKIKEKILGKNNGMYGKTHSEEARKKISEALTGRISKNRNLTPVFCIELNKLYACAVEACLELNIKKDYAGQILQVCRGNSPRKTCGGYHWKFIEDNI